MDHVFVEAFKEGVLCLNEPAHYAVIPSTLAFYDAIDLFRMWAGARDIDPPHLFHARFNQFNNKLL